MDLGRHIGVLPLRPMTVGEVLDAALALLRTRAGVLLGAGLLLAAAEQAALYPVRAWSHATPWYVPRRADTDRWWLLIGVGLGTEAAAVTVLGGLAAAAALPALFGRPVTRARRSPLRVTIAVVLLAAASGSLCGLGALVVLGWPVGYCLLGLAAPAVVIDRLAPQRAMLRSAGLVLRSGLRPGAIRLLGYAGWLMFRLALGFGLVALLGLIPGLSVAPARGWLVTIAWLLVNAVAYPVLGCLDAVLHLEARMRVEGLDIAAGRALRRGEALEPVLAVPRRVS